MADQLPSGNWRPRVRHPRTGKQINPRDVIGGPATYATERAALAAEKEARTLLRRSARAGVTVGEWWGEWTTNPYWLRSAESTNIHNEERTRKFALRYRDTPMRAIDDEAVRGWIMDGNTSTLAKLRLMFADAMTAEAGRLIDFNPFAGLKGQRYSRGRRDKQPPNLAQIAAMVATAERLTPPSFASYLHVAAFEGMRPGELDGLTHDDIDFDKRVIHVERQWNAKARKFTDPKYGKRTIALTDPARERLASLPVESEFAFTTLRGTHYTPSSRSHHWNRVRCSVGLADHDLYLCTRHFFGWYAFNVLELDARDIALHFGHKDGGQLVRKLYGHPDEKLAIEKVLAAFEDANGTVIPLRRKSA
jgi:integrase